MKIAEATAHERWRSFAPPLPWLPSVATVRTPPKPSVQPAPCAGFTSRPIRAKSALGISPQSSGCRSNAAHRAGQQAPRRVEEILCAVCYRPRACRPKPAFPAVAASAAAAFSARPASQTSAAPIIADTRKAQTDAVSAESIANSQQLQLMKGNADPTAHCRQQLIVLAIWDGKLPRDFCMITLFLPPSGRETRGVLSGRTRWQPPTTSVSAAKSCSLMILALHHRASARACK